MERVKIQENEKQDNNPNLHIINKISADVKQSSIAYMKRKVKINKIMIKIKKKN